MLNFTKNFARWLVGWLVAEQIHLIQSFAGLVVCFSFITREELEPHHRFLELAVITAWKSFIQH